jgi:hypothetical protein
MRRDFVARIQGDFEREGCLVKATGVELSGALTACTRFRSTSPPTISEKGVEGIRLDQRLGLAEIARRDRQRFDCATWLHKAHEMPKEEFKREVERS